MGWEGTIATTTESFRRFGTWGATTMKEVRIARDPAQPRVMEAPLVVVGAGPVGMRLCQELLHLLPETPVVVYGSEPWEPYNRVRLSSLLAGEVRDSELFRLARFPSTSRVVTFFNCPVVEIDRERRSVQDIFGRVQSYSKLVLATGSRPRIPSNIHGSERQGIFTFRDMDDAQRLVARRARSHRTVVLGGGLLGLEAARAMQRFHTEVYIIEHNPRLMFGHLDEEAGALLVAHIQSLGVRVILRDSVVEILGGERIEGIRLRSGGTIHCDTLIVATGIIPNVSLALNAGLGVGRGIQVDDCLRTSDPHIYAVGECVEHREKTYGLVGPGFEQAAIAAQNIAGNVARYLGTQSATTLKVVGLPVFSLGEVTHTRGPVRSYYYRDPKSYRRLLLRRGRLVGALAIGEWSELSRVQQAVAHHRRLWPWQLWRFRKRGSPWAAQTQTCVSDWPSNAVVCNCTGVTRGQLGEAAKKNCPTVETLAERTGASTVCGSCKPLLAALLGTKAPLAAIPGLRSLGVLAAVSLVLGLTTLASPRIPMPETVQVLWRWEALWTDGLYKQISGFSLLGLTLIGLLLSLRKRIKLLSFGAFHTWRVVHVALGTLAVVVLAAHTGFRFGANLNLMLMSCFSAVVSLGALAAGAIALERQLGPSLVRSLRRASLWLHILVFWPLPVLLGFHIFKTYYF